MSLTNEGARLTSWEPLACSGVQPLASPSGGLTGRPPASSGHPRLSWEAAGPSWVQRRVVPGPASCLPSGCLRTSAPLSSSGTT